MIQRIQSLYLLVATALMACTLFSPIASVVTADGDTLTLREAWLSLNVMESSL